MKMATQKRSGKHHLIHPDGLATRCGRIIRRTTFTITEARGCDCIPCLNHRNAELRRRWREAINHEPMEVL